MNYFHRWAGTRSFRRWWPVLAPFYSLGFRSFVKERFMVGSVDREDKTSDQFMPAAARLTLTELDAGDAYQNSDAWRFLKQSRRDLEADLPGKKIFG
jgi:hypothetical protein